jgi:DNA repair protein RAD57
MCDISSTIPSFSTTTFTHLLPALDRSGVTVSDLICSEAIDVARRALLPPNEILRLRQALVKALHQDADRSEAAEWQGVSCLDPVLDEALNGGFPAGYLCEITGERFVINLLNQDADLTAERAKLNSYSH